MSKSETTAGRSSEWGRYVLDNAAPQTPARFSALAELYDTATIRHLQQIGVDRGWRCWEIGAGPGSIAQWLAGRCGPDGSVLATDIDTRFLGQSAHANLTVRRHDIVADPLPDEPFDLIHARLVLVHLPERERALDRMVAALKPGGWLLTEEFDSVSQLSAPDRHPGEVTLKSAAAMREAMIGRGVNAGFGRALAGHLRVRGLQDISAEGRMHMWQGKSLGTHLMKANLEQLREAILGTGSVTALEFEDDLARLDQEDFMTPSPAMWSVAARKRMN
ncbi:MAG: methyltransferase domain-containing protein [Prolixibacteraceae bacterium]|nr:methyltransferase domain-containing protein [Burkholderiales bacterium]